MPDRPVRRCPSCDTPWEAADARFCGHCGSALPAATGPSRRDDRSDDDGHPEDQRPRIPWVGLGVVALVAVVLAAVALGGTGVEEPQGDPTDPGVDLPDPDEVDEPAEAPPADADPGAEPVTLDCDPEPCEAWRRDLGTGLVTAVGDILMVVQPGGAFLDPDTTGDRRLLGVSTWTGEILWEVDLDGLEPEGTSFSLRTLDATSAAITVGRTLAIVSTAGELLWEVDLGGSAMQLRRGASEDLIIHVAEEPGDEPADVDDTTDEPLDDGPVSAGAVDLLSLSLLDGEVRWRVDDLVPLVTTETVEVVAQADGTVAALDLGSGELTPWPADSAALLPDGPPDLGSRRIQGFDDRVWIADDGDAVHVLDAASGELLSSQQLDLPAAHQLVLFGPLAVAIQPPPDQEDQRFAARLYDLEQPDADPMEIDEAYDVLLMTADPFRSTGPRGLPPLPGGQDPLRLAVLEVTSGVPHLVVYDLDGSERGRTALSRVDSGATGADAPCCPQLRAHLNDRLLLVTPSVGAGGTIHLVDARDVVTLRTMTLPDGFARSGRLTYYGEVVVHIAEDDTMTARFPGAEVRATARGDVVTFDPAPVLRFRDELIGLDPEVVGPSS